MPRSMHVVRGLTSLNTRKPKIKLTKKRVLELYYEQGLEMGMTEEEAQEYAYEKFDGGQ